MLGSLTVALITALAVAVNSQAQTPNSSFPHAYPGMPKGGFSPAWQNYFEVKDPLPNVTFPLTRSFAGNIPVNRPNHPNDTLFFWGFEHTNGSLTGNSEDPWGIFLNGGPGASSMLGLLLENGPLHIDAITGDAIPNNFSWAHLIDYFWVDQPVGVGYATADATGYVDDEDQMGEDFVQFLTNLVKVFPSLAKRPLVLTGESYAGIYIPYIMKTLFSMKNPPVKVSKMAMGNAAIGSITEIDELPTLGFLETYPQLIGYDPEVYQYFKEQEHLCGFDLNLTYPQRGHFPSFNLNFSADPGAASFLLGRRPQALSRQVLKAVVEADEALKKRGAPRMSRRVLAEREKKRQAWKAEKRDLTGRPNGTIDPWYGCFLFDEATDYALNFSLPWSLHPETLIEDINAFAPLNFYDLPDARFPAVSANPLIFMNDNRTRSALHAPTSKDWSLLIFPAYPFGSTFDIPPNIINPFGDPSPPATAFLSELATNASKHDIQVIIYSGNDDSVVAQLYSQIVIQNTTFGGIQGFTKQPQTPFNDDAGNFAGIIHQERGWSFALIAHAGHEVPEYNPPAALTMFREFILGNNKTGSVEGSSVNGGEEPSLLRDHILEGQSGILVGSGTATSLFFYPSSTIAAWESYIATAITAPPVATPTPP